jgi:hypothetical protein
MSASIRAIHAVIMVIAAAAFAHAIGKARDRRIEPGILRRAVDRRPLQPSNIAAAATSGASSRRSASR